MESAAPEPLELKEGYEDLVYRYVDPATGMAKTSLDVETIPEGVRKEVVVFDAAAPTPAGWEHVVDLSQGLPTTTVPTRGFVLKTRVAAKQPSPQAAGKTLSAVPTARVGAHEVVMFTTQGCGYCRKARKYFANKGIPYSEFDVERDPQARPKLTAMAQRAGVPSNQLQGVPIIFIDGQPLVGFDQGQVGRLLGI
jgi:glutaredoxin 3